MSTKSHLSITYTEAELRNLVEEYITQQKAEFTLKGVCAYIFYWAVEDGKVSDTDSPIEAKKLRQTDQDRVKLILDSIVAEGRIEATDEGYRKFQTYDFKH